MVRHQPASLLDASLGGVAQMVAQCAVRAARHTQLVNRRWRDKCAGYDQSQEEEEESKMCSTHENQLQLEERMVRLGGWIQGHVVHYLTEQVAAAILSGLDQATRRHKATWSATTDNREFTRFLFGIVRFAEMSVVPARKSLLLDEVPQIMRNQLYCCLSHLGPQLTHLNLGSGSGGSCITAFEQTFLKGLRGLVSLQEFTLRYDCTSAVVEVLAATCSSSLRFLDVERSRQVKDSSVAHLLALRQLASLSIFSTGLTEEGQVSLLLGLPCLVDLPRGDFLADALEWLQDQRPEECNNLRLGIQNFWASEEYFFHHSEQLELVSRVCPDIRRMLFMFRNTEAVFSDLLAFAGLEELDLWGGEFYTDDLFLLLTQIGARLTKLNLVHVEEVDRQAITILQKHTPNLRSLSLTSCGFVEPGEPGEAGEQFRGLERQAAREEEAVMASHPWTHLTNLKISSEVGEWVVVRLARSCPRVTSLSLGLHTGLTDEGLARLLGLQGLTDLRHFKCGQSHHLTLASVHQLMFNCEALVTCLNIDYWSKVSEAEATTFRSWVVKSNIELRTTDEKDAAEETPGVASNLPENIREKSFERNL